MKNWWKNLTAQKWFPVAVFLAVICLGVAFYSGMTKDEPITTKTAKGILVPAQKAVTHAAVGVANLYNRMFFYDELLEENEELKQEISDLKRELSDAQDALEENEELREMLGVVERGTEFTYKTAEVVARNIDDWSCKLTVDAGEKDGLELYQCVVNADGLIGYITEISAHSAQVTTVLDPHMQAGATILGTGQLGVACGDYQLMSDKKMKVRYLSHDINVNKGSTVQTSGSGGVFPEGLFIGSVEKVETESDGMSDYAIVKPFANVTTVSRVFVITDYSVSD